MDKQNETQEFVHLILDLNSYKKVTIQVKDQLICIERGIPLRIKRDIALLAIKERAKNSKKANKKNDLSIEEIK